MGATPLAITGSTRITHGSKAAADMLGAQFFQNHGVQVVRARSFNHTGPGQGPEFVCSDFARQFAAIASGLAPPAIRVGNVNIRRDFSDVRDVVRAYALLIHKGTPGQAYNVASGRAVSLREVLGILHSLCPREVKIDVDQQRLRKGEADFGYYYDLNPAFPGRQSSIQVATLFERYRGISFTDLLPLKE